jgi:tetratricopeptide (TPR) repeat protein
VASRQQVKLMDAATAEEVLTLRGRAQLASNSHGFNPRVRFRPDGRSLLAICDDTSYKLAEWSIAGDSAAEAEARLRVVRRRAVDRHLADADILVWKGEPTWRRRAALDHLEQAARIGLESPWEFLRRAEILALLDLPERADEDVERAVALAPGDDAIPARAALIHAVRGRFREAARWYSRMSSRPSALFSIDSLRHAQALMLAGERDRYRWLCEESVRRFEAKEWSGAGDMAVYLTLEPVPVIDAGRLVRIARHESEAASAGREAWKRSWGTIDLGAAHVRAGDLAQAEACFREAIARPLSDHDRACCDGWLAIALWHQGRREEAKACFDRIDHFVRARLPGGRPELEHRPPDELDPWSWWHVIIIWREAHALLLHDAFPADPFAR